MASVYFGLNRGQSEMNIGAVTVGSATGGTDVELRVDTGKSLTRFDVERLTEALLRYVQAGKFDTSLPL